MKHLKHLGAVALAALLVGCVDAAGEQAAQEAAPSDATAVAEITAANQRLLEAYLARDLDGWIAGFAEDIVLMPPGEFMIVGIDAAREASRAQFSWLEGYESEIDGETLETVVAGDWAYTRTTYEVRHRPIDGGEEVVDRARSMTIWRRQPDGRWLASRHMNNRPQLGPSEQVR